MTDVSISLPVNHNARNTIIRRVTLFLVLSIFLTPSALYYYYRAPRARVLTQDKEYVQDINALARSGHLQLLPSPTPIPPDTSPFPQDTQHTFFIQLFYNFWYFITSYTK